MALLPPPRVLPRPAPPPDPPPPPLFSALLSLSLALLLPLLLFLCPVAQALHQGVVKFVCLAVISTPLLAAFGRPSTLPSKPRNCTHTKFLSRPDLDRAADGRPYTQRCLIDKTADLARLHSQDDSTSDRRRRSLLLTPISSMLLSLCLIAQALHQGVVKFVCLAVISTPLLAAFGRPSTLPSKPRNCTHTKFLSRPNLDRAADGRPYTQRCLLDSETDLMAE